MHIYRIRVCVAGADARSQEARMRIGLAHEDDETASNTWSTTAPVASGVQYNDDNGVEFASLIQNQLTFPAYVLLSLSANCIICISCKHKT